MKKWIVATVACALAYGAGFTIGADDTYQRELEAWNNGFDVGVPTGRAALAGEMSEAMPDVTEYLMEKIDAGRE
jgi:hypothetical protein